MADKIILCRRDRAEIGARKDYCSAPITEFDPKKNPMAWCDEDRKRLPIWSS